MLPFLHFGNMTDLINRAPTVRAAWIAAGSLSPMPCCCSTADFPSSNVRPGSMFQGKGK